MPSVSYMENTSQEKVFIKTYKDLKEFKIHTNFGPSLSYFFFLVTQYDTYKYPNQNTKHNKGKMIKSPIYKYESSINIVKNKRRYNSNKLRSFCFV